MSFLKIKMIKKSLSLISNFIQIPKIFRMPIFIGVSHILCLSSDYNSMDNLFENLSSTTVKLKKI